MITQIAPGRPIFTHRCDVALGLSINKKDMFANKTLRFSIGHYIIATWCRFRWLFLILSNNRCNTSIAALSSYSLNAKVRSSNFSLVTGRSAARCSQIIAANSPHHHCGGPSMILYFLFALFCCGKANSNIWGARSRDRIRSGITVLPAIDKIVSR